MTATIEDVAKKKPEPSAEQAAAAELVRLAKEPGLSLTGAMLIVRIPMVGNATLSSYPYQRQGRTLRWPPPIVGADGAGAVPDYARNGVAVVANENRFLHCENGSRIPERTAGEVEVGPRGVLPASTHDADLECLVSKVELAVDSFIRRSGVLAGTVPAVLRRFVAR